MFGSSSRRRFGVAVAVVVATVGFAVGNASAADRHFPVRHHPIACPLWIGADGSRPVCSPIHRLPILTTTTTVAGSTPTSIVSTPTTVKAPVTTIPKPVTTSTTVPTTITVPKTPITIVGCPNPGPIRAEAKTANHVCPLATTNSTKVSGSSAGASTVAIKSSAAEISTACVITRDQSGAESSSGCDN